MSFLWFDLLVLFGIMQGMISSAVLVFRKTKGKQQQHLVCLLLVLCMLGFKIEIHTLGLWDTGFFRYFPLGIDLLVQPMLFLYVRSLTRPDLGLRAGSMLHFLAPALFWLHSLWIYLSVLPLAELQQKDGLAAMGYFDQVKAVEDVLSVLSALCYGYLCLVYVRKYQRWLYQSTSDTRYPTLSWLRNLLVVTAVLGLYLSVNILVDFAQGSSFLRWQFFYLYLTFVIYYLGIRGLTFLPENLVVNLPTAGFLPGKQQKYELSDLEAAKPRILALLQEEKVFLDSEITLEKLSSQLRLSPGLVSATINRLWGRSFRSVINDCRVAEVKLRLVDPAYAHLSLLGIALECGFNSEASFYRIFKAEVGLSPREYLQKHRM